METWTALLLGLGGSLHCVGMCGPLTLALKGGDHPTPWLLNRLLYNGGRIATYTLLGGVSGLLGGVLAMAGLQRWLSVLLGAAIVLAIIGPLALRRRLGGQVPWSGLVVWLKQALGRLFHSRAPLSMLAIGLLNGLLPCGFAYLALAASLTTGGPLQGMSYMAAFGAGTAPALLATALTGRLLNLGGFSLARRLLPIGAVALGLLLVLRGLAPEWLPHLPAGSDHGHH
ncbi:MAG: sulfite exporter TauE/SafE family protein [Candidatus Latescibacteria bacterium]|nr:sulfite exporter TauE/SafE family protein [Candidatus Latescibacterota bacterium]